MQCHVTKEMYNSNSSDTPYREVNNCNVSMGHIPMQFCESFASAIQRFRHVTWLSASSAPPKNLNHLCGRSGIHSDLPGCYKKDGNMMHISLIVKV